MKNMLKYCLTVFITVVIIISCILYVQDGSSPKAKGYINIFTNDNSYDYLKKCSESFMKDNNRAHIEIKSVSEYGETDKNSYNKDKFSNVLLLNRSDFENLKENNNIKYKDMKKILDTYSKNFSKSRLSQIVTEDDNSIGIPLNSKPLVLYVRNDMLSQYGYSSDDINTWDDFIKLGKDIYNKSNKTVNILNGVSNDYNDLTSLLIMQYMDEDSNEEDTKKKVVDKIEELKNNNILNLKKNGKFLARISSINAMKEIELIDEKCEWVAINPPSLSIGTNRFYCEEGENLVVLDNNKDNNELIEKFITYLLTHTDLLVDYMKKGEFFSSYLYSYKNSKIEEEIKNFTGRSPLVIMSNIEEKAPSIKQYDKYIKIKSKL